MREGGFNVGGEQSGHLVFLDWASTGDGTCSALQVLRIMLESGKKLSELKACMTRLPQVLVNANVREKRRIEDMPAVMALIQDVEGKLNGKGRVLVRYSGTENKIRVMLEGEDEKAIKGWADEIIGAVMETLGPVPA
jgi:phosphoglucosamine mutase